MAENIVCVQSASREMIQR